MERFDEEDELEVDLAESPELVASAVLARGPAGAGIELATNGIVVRRAGVFATLALAAGLGISITDASGAAGDPTIAVDPTFPTMTVQQSLVFPAITSGITMSLRPHTSGSVIRVFADETSCMVFRSTGVDLAANGRIQWTNLNNNPLTTVDIAIERDGAGALGQRRTTTAQTYRLYKTYTDASNYERLAIDWQYQADTIQILSQAAGTGIVRSLRIGTAGDAGLAFVTNASVRWIVDASGHFGTNVDNTYDIGGSGSITKPRSIYVGTSVVVPAGSATVPSVAIGESNTGFLRSASSQIGWTCGGAERGRLYSHTVWIISDTGQYTLGAAQDVVIVREAADTLALRRGANGQAFRLYNTFTDASNYERGVLGWNANSLELRTSQLGTGVARGLKVFTDGAVPLSLGTNATIRWQVDASGHFVAASDNTYDIGASGSTRPRTVYVGTSIVNSGYLDLIEMAAPGSANTNRVRIYAEDNGAGKTRLMAIFATGAAQQIAIEP